MTTGSILLCCLVLVHLIALVACSPVGVAGVNVAGVDTSKVLSDKEEEAASSNSNSKPDLPCAKVAGTAIDAGQTVKGVGAANNILKDTKVGAVQGGKECTEAEKKAEDAKKAGKGKKEKMDD